jgi:hypothetical protein
MLRLILQTAEQRFSNNGNDNGNGNGSGNGNGHDHVLQEPMAKFNKVELDQMMN